MIALAEFLSGNPPDRLGDENTPEPLGLRGENAHVWEVYRSYRWYIVATVSENYYCY